MDGEGRCWGGEKRRERGEVEGRGGDWEGRRWEKLWCGEGKGPRGWDEG